MLGAPAEIDQLFRMTQGECTAAPDVAGIGGTGGVAVAQRFRQRRIADDAGPAAIPYGLIFLIPARGGQPNLDLDIGVV